MWIAATTHITDGTHLKQVNASDPAVIRVDAVIDQMDASNGLVQLPSPPTVFPCFAAEYVRFVLVFWGCIVFVIHVV